MKSIIITTEHRGVFYAEVEDNTDLTQKTLQNLKNCRMAIYWGTTKGIQELADTGPTPSSKISSPSDIIILHDVTAIFSVTEEAKVAWNNA